MINRHTADAASSLSYIVWAAVGWALMLPIAGYAESISLPCPMNTLLQAGASVNLGGLRFSGFSVNQLSDAGVAGHITVQDGSEGGNTGLVFVPDETYFAVTGVGEKRFEFAYVVESISAGNLLGATAKIQAQAQVDAHVDNQLFLRLPLADSDFGSIVASVDSIFGNQLMDSFSIPSGADSVHVGALLWIESFQSDSFASLINAKQTFTVVPEPSTATSCICASLIVGCAVFVMFRNRRERLLIK